MHSLRTEAAHARGQWSARAVRAVGVLALAGVLSSPITALGAPSAAASGAAIASTGGTTPYVDGSTIEWTADSVPVANPSSDGTAGFDGSLNGVAGGASALVLAGMDMTAGAAEGASWVSTDDGATWIEHLVAGTGPTGFSALAASGGIFVAASAVGFWRSTDGAAWTRAASGPAALDRVALSRGRSGFIALVTKAGATSAWTSADGSAWATLPNQAVIRGFCPASIAASSSQAIAVGTACGSAATPQLVVSVDGLAWTKLTVPAGMDAGQASISVAGGRFVIIAPYHDATHSGTAVWSSTSGSSWSRTSFLTARAASPDVIQKVVPLGSGWIGAGWAADNADECTAIAWSSADLVHWTRAQLTAPPVAGTCQQPFAIDSYLGRVLAVGRAWDQVSTSPTVWEGTLVAPAQPALTLSQASATAVTRTGPFTLSTKVLHRGGYVTIRIATAPAVAGADVGIWIAKKGPDGTWSAFSPHTSRRADANGVVYYFYRAYSTAWLSFQARYSGDATHPAGISNAVQARWGR